MAGKRKTPQLRFDGRCYVVNVYRPDGKRTMFSFGPPGERTEGEIYTTFGKWFDLFNQFPHKVLSYKSPYEAVEQLVNPNSIITIGDLLDKYLAWIHKAIPPAGENGLSDVVVRTERIKRFLKKYHHWPVSDFGPDELRGIQW